MNRARLCLVFLLAAILLTGCQTMTGYWKDTKRLYGEYVNPPASLDLEDVGECEIEEARLAYSFTEMDYQFFALERALEGSPMPPTDEWVAQLMGRFPWLSGVTAVSNTGAILGQTPPTPMKPLEYSPLLETPEGRNHMALRAYAQDTPMGPEVYVGVPIYAGNDFKGILVTHFDPRTVLKFSRAPEDLIIMTPDLLLWPGRYGTANAVVSADWKGILRSKYCGSVGKSPEDFYWVVRHLANLPMIFAVPIDENYAAPSQQTAESPGQPSVQQETVRGLN